MRRALAISVAMSACAAQPGDLFFQPELVDLGESIAGAEHLARVEVFNQSAAPLRLGRTLASSPGFSLDYPGGAILPAHGKVAVTLRYAPSASATAADEATLELWTGDGIVAHLRARGTPTKPKCTAPDELDFGGVAFGNTSVMQVELENELPQEDAAHVQLTSGEGFSLSTETLVIGPGERRPLAIAFNALAVRAYEGSVSIQPNSLCEARTLRLRADGVPSVLGASSSFLRWQIAAGTTQVQEVTLSNHGLAPVRLFNFEVLAGVSSSPGSEFRVTRVPLTIPAAQRRGNLLVPGLATLELSFTAGVRGFHAARLNISTDLSSNPLIGLSLEGRSQ